MRGNMKVENMRKNFETLEKRGEATIEGQSTKKKKSGRKKISNLIVILSIIGLLAVGCDKGEKIEEIAGYTVYSKEYEKSYRAAVNFANYLAGDDREGLYRTVCNPSLAPSAEAYQLASGLQPENHYNQFRELVMISRVAEKEGFLDDPEIKEILELTRLQTIAQLYLGKKIREKKYEVTEDEKIKACQELRKKEPERMASLSASECLEVGEQFVRRQMMQVQSGIIEDDVKELATVKKNAQFDREEFLKNIALFKEIQKEGGCLEEEEKSESEDEEESSTSETIPNPAEE